MSTEGEKSVSQQCIECTTGAYLVLAGPGTGKTYTVIHRIENLVKKENVRPETVLCLTFSNAAAKEMIDRLKKDVNIEGVNIFTFHGLCLDIIDKYREKLEVPENYALVNDVLKDDLMRQCLTEKKPEYWTTTTGNDYYYVSELIGAISEIKRNRITKERYFDNIEENPDFMPSLDEAKGKLDVKQTKGAQADVTKLENRIGKAKEAWAYYELYSEKLKSYGLIDFDDCISIVLNAFEKDSDFVKEAASKYRFLMADEYQDTNVSQNGLVIRLGKVIKNVFAVGDDDQMIYRFQGADIGSINNYITAFNPKVFCLQNNYRSCQNILDAADIMANEDSTGRVVNNPSFANSKISKRLTQAKKEIPNNDVVLNVFADAKQERKAVVNDIEKLIASDNCPKDKNTGEKALNEIAILVRTNNEATEYAQLLASHKVKCEVKKGSELLEIEGANILLCYLKALAAPKRYSGSLFFLLRSRPFEICAEDFFYLWSEDLKEGKKGSAIEIFENGLKENKIKEREKILKIVSVFNELKKDKYESIHALIDDIGNKTGLYEYYTNLSDGDVQQAGFDTLKSIAQGWTLLYKSTDLYGFIAYLQKLQDNRVSLSVEKQSLGATENAVQVVTYHGSKGREFAYVFMPNLTDKAYEDKKDKNIKLPLSEYSDGGKDGRKAAEKRDNIKLLFVGMTRARHTLNLSYALKTDSEKDTDLTELMRHVAERIITKDRTTEIYADIELAEEDPVKALYDYEGDYKKLTEAYINQIKNFSATNLNAYMACPARYFLERVIRIKDDGDTTALGYGSSVHAACEHLVKKAIENKNYPSLEEFTEIFESEITKRFYDTVQRDDIIKKGRENLPAFYSYLVSKPVSSLFGAELSITSELKGIDFISKIDRLEKDDKGDVQIYDYKTGKPKNSDVICWGGDHEDYFRQLGMYAYVYEQMNKGSKVNKTGFIFPDGAKNQENEFTLSFKEEDIERIVKDYEQAIDDINNGKFGVCSKGSKTCVYCPFRATICKREKAGF